MESLVRLGALDAGLVGGTDFVAGMQGASGITRCEAFSPNHDWDFLNRTTCEGASAGTTVRLRLPPALRGPGGAVLVLSAKRVRGAEPVDVTLTLGGQALSPLRVGPQWSEQRLALDAATIARLRGTSITATLRTGAPGVALRLDHLLLVPRPTEVATSGAAP
jgi:hypothetical protein